MNDWTHDPWTRWAATVSAILLALILAWAVAASLMGPSLSERMDRMEAHMQFQTCLLFFEEMDRQGAVVSECIPPPFLDE